MSIFTRAIAASAASSRHGLTAGTGTDATRLSWREISAQAHRMAGGLSSRGVGRHGSVAVLAASAADVAPLAQSIWLRRAALTMLQHPTPRGDLAVWLTDTVKAVRTIRADVIVVGEPFLAAVDQLAGHKLTVCTVDSLRNAAQIHPGEVDDAEETEIAIRQLTSGATGTPKAVEISHGNLAAHTTALSDAVDIDPDTDVLASWLPLSHDMGMIAFVCFPMQLDLEVAMITSDQFLRRPLAWAELITRHRATITSGPNFGYSVLARHLQNAELGRFDFSALRVAVNGAEPINHRDVAAFATAGARFGLRPSAPTPAYGLAEATLVVSMGAPLDLPCADTVSRDMLAQHQYAHPVPEDSVDAQQVVCLGAPVTGMQLRIVRDANLLGAREVGGIELRGPTVASSLLTAEGTVPLARQDGWFDTGDLGYADEQGRIYVCGRAKDVIVLAGQNLYPHDIERAAEKVDGVRTGCVIALRIEAEHEGFAVLAEVRVADDADAAVRIRRDITAQVNRQVGHAPREVRLFPAGTLPKTPSGKLRRNQARELLCPRPVDAT